jgi:DNA replication and repair protein RecF
VGRIRRLILASFRNYDALDLEIGGQLVALIGDNGAGKTNILEAVSLLSPGRGLRRADFSDMRRQGAAGAFALSVVLDGPHGEVQLGAGHDPQGGNGRTCRINRTAVASAAAFAQHCRVLWLTPESDGLFRGPAGDRRRFMDRLVLAVDAEHGGRVTALEKALRSRNRLLEDDRPDTAWLDAVEREAAETAIAVAAARRETVQRLAALIMAEADPLSPFPHARLAVAGDIETALNHATALEAEDWYLNVLRDNRWRDKAAGRALIGPNTSDLAVRHGPKDMPAELCSTGEQKALLLGLVLAHARLVRQMSGLPPLLLLDEVAAHLDPQRREALFRILLTLGGQVWMTGTDAALFDTLPEGAERYFVVSGRVEPLTDKPPQIDGWAQQT